MPPTPFKNAKLIETNRLIDVWQKPDGSCFAKAKRLSAADKIACPLSTSERQAYRALLGNSVSIIKHLRDHTRPGISLKEAWDLVKSARAPAYRFYYNSAGELINKKLL